MPFFWKITMKLIGYGMGQDDNLEGNAGAINYYYYIRAAAAII